MFRSQNNSAPSVARLDNYVTIKTIVLHINMDASLTVIVSVNIKIKSRVNH